MLYDIGFIDINFANNNNNFNTKTVYIISRFQASTILHEHKNKTNKQRNTDKKYYNVPHDWFAKSSSQISLLQTTKKKTNKWNESSKNINNESERNHD